MLVLQLKRVGPAFDRIYRKEQNENLDKIEQANNTLENKMDSLISGKIDDVALQTDIEQKLSNLEAQYAPRLTEVTEQLAKTATYITPEMFGAKGDGVTDDTEALQNMILYARKSENLTTIHSQKHKVYLITQPLVLGAYQYFNFGHATIKAGAPMEFVISINTSNNRWGRVENLTIDCDNKANKGIYIPYSRLFIFSGIQILNFNTHGFHCVSGNVIARDLYIDKNITSSSITTDSIGMLFDGTDSKVYSVSVRDCKIGIQNNSGINYFVNVHCWLISPSTIPDSIAFLIKGSAVLANCYADTYYIAVKNDNEQMLMINGLHVYINKEYYTVSNLNDKEPYIFYLTQSSTNTDTYPNSARKIKINSLSADVTITGFTNKAKFSNIPGQIFSEITQNYDITNFNQLPSGTLDNLPTKTSTSEFSLIGTNYTVLENVLTKNGTTVIGDLHLSVIDKSLLATNTAFKIANIPSGYFPKNTFFTTCTFGSDSGSILSICHLRVNSSSSGGRYLEVTIPDTFTSASNANRLRVHVNYDL